MPTPVGEFFVNLFFKANTMTLKDVVSGISELNARSVLAMYGLDKVYDKLHDITTEAVKTAQSLNLFEKTTGISADTMQRWGDVSEQFGGSAKDIQQDMANIEQRLRGMRWGTPDQGIIGASYLLQQGGANLDLLSENYESFFRETRQGLKGLTKDEQYQALALLNVSASMKQRLLMSDEQLRREDDVARMLKPQIETLVDMGAEWKKLDQDATSFGYTIAAKISPALKIMALEFQELMAGLKESETFSLLLKLLEKILYTIDAIIFGWKLLIKDLPGAVKGMYQDWATSDFAGAALAGQKQAIAQKEMKGYQSGEITQSQNNNINVTVHGVLEGATAVGQAVAQEISNYIKRTQRTIPPTPAH